MFGSGSSSVAFGRSLQRGRFLRFEPRYWGVLANQAQSTCRNMGDWRKVGDFSVEDVRDMRW